MAHDDLAPEEKLLADNLHAILNGTFEAGLGIIAVGKALKTHGKISRWKLIAVSKFLESHGDEVSTLVGMLSAATLAKLKAACDKRA